MEPEPQASAVPEPSVPNLAFVEHLYHAWVEEPSSVPEPWQRYFERLPAIPGTGPVPDAFPPRRLDGDRAAAPDGTIYADAAFQE